jgi:lambda family phage portal protein
MTKPQHGVNDVVKSGSLAPKTLRTFIPSLNAPNTDYDQPTRELTLSRARQLYNSDTIAASVVGRFEDNCIGKGLNPKSTIDYRTAKITREKAKELQEQFESDFRHWANSKHSDISLKHNFYAKQWIAFVTYIVSGEVFASIDTRKRGFTFNTVCQIIEPERVSNPHNVLDRKNFRQGIETNNDGVPIAFHITDEHPAEYINIPGSHTWKRHRVFGRITGRRKLLHVFKPKRDSQVRGISMLSPVIEALKQVSRANENELLALVLQGMLTFFMTQKESDEPTAFDNEKTDEAQLAGIIGKNEVAIGNGTMVELPEGREITMANPTRPTSGYEPFIQFMLTFIASAMGIPYEVLALKFDSSYTAARGAFIQAAMTYEKMTHFFGQEFCQFYYAALIDEGVANGRYNLPNYSDPLVRCAYISAVWEGPRLAQIDEVKEANAAGIRIKHKITSRKHEREKMGINSELMDQQIEQEEQFYKDTVGDIIINENKQDNE